MEPLSFGGRSDSVTPQPQLAHVALTRAIRCCKDALLSVAIGKGDIAVQGACDHLPDAFSRRFSEAQRLSVSKVPLSSNNLLQTRAT